MAERKENCMLTNKNMFIYIESESIKLDQLMINDLEFIKNNFCGKVMTGIDQVAKHRFAWNTIVFMAGDIERIYGSIQDKRNKLFCVVKELSNNYIVDHQTVDHHQTEDSTKKDSNDFRLISIGEVPVNVHNMGVFFRNFFDSKKEYFNAISGEHTFQYLKESNKPGVAFRKGIYLSNVEEIDDGIQFNLLRCSTNLSGPTDNFRSTDHEILDKVNELSKYFFQTDVQLNHVLAQIYHNSMVGNQEKKAKISSHSDKTKDMPANGLIAFCTFYDNSIRIKKSTTDPYDYCYNNTSVLTVLRFKLKDCVPNADLRYAKQFDVTLYPDSVFIISLLTNRLYTHEIVPSVLPIQHIPVRMGYVARCSNRTAFVPVLHTTRDKDLCALEKNMQTYIVEEKKKGVHRYIKLEKPTGDNVKELKDLYFKENTTADLIDYGAVYFSLNDGDYEKPIV